MSIDWGELRSLSARLLSSPKDLKSLEALLPPDEQRLEALRYLYDHLERALGLDLTLSSKELAHPMALEWHIQLLSHIGHVWESDEGKGVDALVWLLLQQPDKRYIELTCALLGAHMSKTVESATLVRWCVEGEPTLAQRISTRHHCEPQLWRQFLAAWAWCVIIAPTSSPILTLRKLPEDVWIIKSWPSAYGHGLDSSGWEIHCDEARGAKVTKLLCEIWPGLSEELLTFQELRQDEATTPQEPTP